MSKEIYDLSATAAANNYSPSDGGFPEGMSRSDVNNAAREVLSTMRRWYNDSEWIQVRHQGPLASDIGVFSRTSANVFTITLAGVDLSSYFTDLRVIKIIDGGGAGVDLVTQCDGDATYGAGVTTVTTKAAMNAAASDAYTHSIAVLRRQGLLEDRTDFFIPVTTDSAGILAACQAADAAGNGIVLLTEPSYTIDTEIDLTGLGNFTIMGAGRGTTLLRSGNIDAMIVFHSAADNFALRNVRFNGNWGTFGTGNGIGLEVNAFASMQIQGCQFDNCRDGILIVSTSGNHFSVSETYFRNYRFGIANSAVTNTHQGSIVNCTFDSGLVNVSSAAQVKVAGGWRISACHFNNMGHASLAPFGVWIWDKAGASTGGQRSVVQGNIFVAGGGTTGTCIWAGADDVQVIGNQCTSPSTGVGVLIGSISAGNPAERVSCVGNSISQGAKAIQVLGLARHCNITSNAIRPNSGVGIECGGDLCVISQNTIRGSGGSPLTSGIDLISGAVQNLVSGNLLMDSISTNGVVLRSGSTSNTVRGNYVQATLTNGVIVESGSTNNLVADNYSPTAGSKFVNSDTTTRFTRNEEILLVAYGEPADITNYSSEQIAITMDLPGGGGIGSYLLEFYGVMDSTASTVDSRVRARIGTAGDLTDGSVMTETSTSSTSSDVEHSSYNDGQTVVAVSDATYDKVTFSLEKTSGGATVNFRRAWFKVTKISEPLG